PAPAPRRRLPPPPPPPSAGPAHARPRSAPELLERGLLDEADAAVAAASHPRDALSWTTMRALLDGRQDAARTGLDELRGLAERTNDAEAWSRYWIQRFWAAFEWGGEEERYDLLDHCRDRAYRFDDLHWWGNLALLLAAMGKHEEAARAFDDALRLAAPVSDGAVRLDVLTNLIETGALLGEPGRVAEAARHLRVVVGRLVVVGEGVVCKGSVDRYLGLAHAALGRWGDAGECFRSAEATHRLIGAQPLLVRTVQQASGALVAA
ncbi:MAG: hypothetical protein ACR2KK_19590, partial [Acidimicrobiales bacterium]